jgi:SAM-dependent methyltransferase
MNASEKTQVKGALAAQDFWLETLGDAEAYTHWILDEIKPYLGRRILEVGCGTGTYTVPLGRAGHTITGVDLDPAYAEEAARRSSPLPTVTVRQGDATDPACDLGAAFDTVMLLDVLEHIEDDETLLARLRSRLEPDGRLVLKVPAIKALYSPMDKAIGHWRRYDRAGLRGVLTAAGFSVERVWSFNAFAVPGWWLNGRLLGRETPPGGQVALFNRLIPVLRPIDRVLRHLGGLSYFAVGRAT